MRESAGEDSLPVDVRQSDQASYESESAQAERVISSRPVVGAKKFDFKFDFKLIVFN